MLIIKDSQNIYLLLISVQRNSTFTGESDSEVTEKTIVLDLDLNFD